MRLLTLVVIFLFIAINSGSAQVGTHNTPTWKPNDLTSNPPEPPPDRPDERPNERPNHEHVKPELTGINNNCTRPGEKIDLNGRHLSAWKKSIPALDIGGSFIKLIILRHSDTQIVAQIPQNERWRGDKRYPIVLLDQRSGQLSIRTRFGIHICAEKAIIETRTSKPKPSTGMENDGAEPGEILILTDSKEAPRILKLVQQNNYRILRRHELPSFGNVILILKVQDGNVSEVIEDLRKLFPDAKIDRNHYYYSSSAPRVYGPKKINWPADSQCASKGRAISIGLIDSAIDQNHPDLSNHDIVQKNFIFNGNSDKQHGTALASILLGNNTGLGFQKKFPGGTLYAASVLKTFPGGTEAATTESVSLALDWLIKKKIRLINISLASSKPNKILNRIFEQTIRKGALIFAAAGNNGPGASPTYPASIKKVIAVTAVDAADRIYKQANQGRYVDFSAPGVDIWVAQNSNGAYKSGTSYAVPFVLSVAAQSLTRNPSLSYDLVMKILQSRVKDLGDVGRDEVYGWGLVQAKNNCGAK